VQRDKLLQGAVFVHPLRDPLRDGWQKHTPIVASSKQSFGEALRVVVIEGCERQALLEVHHDGLDDGTVMKYGEHVRIPHQPADCGEVVTVISLVRVLKPTRALADALEQDEAVDR
jgi:hypothetical protein